jgi:hypothetical protein
MRPVHAESTGNLLDLSFVFRVDKQRRSNHVFPYAAGAWFLQLCRSAQILCYLRFALLSFVLLNQEQGVEHDRFRKSDRKNGLHQNLVEATGFRPTASEAFMPIRPTAMAAPRAARPTSRLPVI